MIRDRFLSDDDDAAIKWHRHKQRRFRFDVVLLPRQAELLFTRIDAAHFKMTSIQILVYVSDRWTPMNILKKRTNYKNYLKKVVVANLSNQEM